jgi:hypothetical protein
MSQTRSVTPAAIAGVTRSPTAPAARLNTLRRGCVMVSRRSLQRDADRCCDAANCRSEALMRPSEENNLSMIPGRLTRRDTPCSRPMTASGPSATFDGTAGTSAHGREPDSGRPRPPPPLLTQCGSRARQRTAVVTSQNMQHRKICIALTRRAGGSAMSDIIGGQVGEGSIFSKYSSGTPLISPLCTEA